MPGRGWGPRRSSACAAGGIVSRARAAPLAARGRREPQEEPDILECEVKSALGSIAMNKTWEVMEFQLSYFKS